MPPFISFSNMNLLGPSFWSTVFPLQHMKEKSPHIWEDGGRSNSINFLFSITIISPRDTSETKDGHEKVLSQKYCNKEVSLIEIKRQKWQKYLQFSSVAHLCLILCDPMDFSTPGLPVHHQLLEFTQTHVHWVGDAMQPSHPLSSPSPPTFNLSQHQDLFQWVSSSHQVARVLEFQLQHQSFQWIFRTGFYIPRPSQTCPSFPIPLPATALIQILIIFFLICLSSSWYVS